MTRILVIGPAGAGKSTVGRSLAARLGYPFVDADDLHSASNKAKMRAGLVLNDEDRSPWLAAIGAVLDEWERAGTGGVLASSLLKRAYRDELRRGRTDVRFVYLETNVATLEQRVLHREHFMPPVVLAGQLDIFEPPAPDEHAITIHTRLVDDQDLQAAVAAAVDQILAHL